MTEQKRDLLTHLLLAWLQSIGLSLPLCALLGLSGFVPYVIVSVSVLLPLLELSRLHKLAFRCLPVLLLAAAALFFFVFNGSSLINDLLVGVSLQIRDTPVSLVLFGKETALVIAIVIAITVFYVSVPDVGSMILLSLTVLVFALLWYWNRPDLLWSFAPALVATVLFLLKLSKPEISQLRLILPITAVIVFALLITPFSGIVSGPLKEAADDLRQTVTDQFFFTDARNVFSLADEGFYPEGQSQLGGKAELSDRPVMEVSAPEKLYLRGVIFDRYSGRNWTQSAGGRRYPWSSRTWNQLRSETFCMDRPLSDTVTRYFTPVSFSVRMLNEKASTLFIPQAIRELRPGGNLVPHFNASSEVFITRNLLPGDTYSGTAFSFISGDPGLGTLIDVCGKAADPQYARIVSDYTVLPDHLESPVYELAKRITESSTTPYEKAFAIQNWLSRNCTYRLDVEDQPPDLDFVTNFLMNTKEGYCTYFASAMTVLSRIMGLPARYVEGYLFRPGENGNAVLTGQNAHAWTEIYFSGFGWVTFDATPATESGNSKQSAPEPTPTPTPPPQSETTPETENRDNEPTPSPEKDQSYSLPSDPPRDTPLPTDPPVAPEQKENRSSAALLWILLLFIVLGLIAARILLTDPHYLESKATKDLDRLRISTQYLYDLLYTSGLEPRKGETPMSFMKRCDRSGLVPTSVARAGACVSVICYAHLEPEGEEMLLVRNTADRYFRQLPFSGKLRYILYRSFVPLSKRRFDTPSLPISDKEERPHDKHRNLKTRFGFRNLAGSNSESKPSERL